MYLQGLLAPSYFNLFKEFNSTLFMPLHCDVVMSLCLGDYCCCSTCCKVPTFLLYYRCIQIKMLSHQSCYPRVKLSEEGGLKPPGFAHTTLLGFSGMHRKNGLLLDEFSFWHLSLKWHHCALDPQHTSRNSMRTHRTFQIPTTNYKFIGLVLVLCVVLLFQIRSLSRCAEDQYEYTPAGSERPKISHSHSVAFRFTSVSDISDSSVSNSNSNNNNNGINSTVVDQQVSVYYYNFTAWVKYYGNVSDVFEVGTNCPVTRCRWVVLFAHKHITHSLPHATHIPYTQYPTPHHTRHAHSHAHHTPHTKVCEQPRWGRCAGVSLCKKSNRKVNTKKIKTSGWGVVCQMWEVGVSSCCGGVSSCCWYASVEVDFVWTRARMVLCACRQPKLHCKIHRLEILSFAR